MTLLERVTTDGVADLDEWRAHISQTFVPLSSDVLPWAPGFRADLHVGDIGVVQIARVVATPQTVWRSAADLDTGSAPQVKVSLVVSGRTEIEQGDVATVVEPGQVVVYHCDRQYRLSMHEPFEQLVLSVDRHLLPVAAGRACVLPDASVFTRCLYAMVTSLGAGDESGEASRSDEVLLGDKLLDFLSMAIAPVGRAEESGPTDRQLYVRAVGFVRSNLGDPALAPAVIADAIGVSERKLFALFRAEGVSVMDFVTRERLDRARLTLATSEGDGRTITDIATSCGFKTSAHFTRRFVQQFELTPRDYRSTSRRN
ncbi:MAG: helix-turn-helix domain-containing protein [Actinomycetota bacterium]